LNFEFLFGNVLNAPPTAGLSEIDVGTAHLPLALSLDSGGGCCTSTTAGENQQQQQSIPAATTGNNNVNDINRHGERSAQGQRAQRSVSKLTVKLIEI
jgi:hypothetical protein